jgi:hypothetical protein
MIGRNVLFTDEHLWANRLKVCATGRAIYKPGGFTAKWSGVTAVSGTDVVLEDGQTILIGEKYLRYGQVIVEDTDGTFIPATDLTPLVPGRCFVLDYTVTDQEPNSPNFGGASDNMSPAFKARLLVGDTGQPTWEDFYAAFPNITFAVSDPGAEAVSDPSTITGTE